MAISRTARGAEGPAANRLAGIAPSTAMNIPWRPPFSRPDALNRTFSKLIENIFSETKWLMFQVKCPWNDVGEKRPQRGFLTAWRRPTSPHALFTAVTNLQHGHHAACFLSPKYNQKQRKCVLHSTAGRETGVG